MINSKQRTRELLDEIKDVSGSKPRGGDRFIAKAEAALERKQFKLFVPWAASAASRTELSVTDRNTLDWLSSEAGLSGRLSAFGTVKHVMMFADSYAARNGFDMSAAWQYWCGVSRYFNQRSDAEFTTASEMDDTKMQALQASRAYAFEELDPEQQRKILQTASRYSGENDELAIYEAAATYSMLRAAEAEYVTNELDAIWVSPNWQERDIMCGDTPRIYIPEQLRAPWLKEV